MQNMVFSDLTLPNWHVLSDCVIGNVIPRTKPARTNNLAESSGRSLGTHLGDNFPPTHSYQQLLRTLVRESVPPAKQHKRTTQTSTHQRIEERVDVTMPEKRLRGGFNMGPANSTKTTTKSAPRTAVNQHRRTGTSEAEKLQRRRDSRRMYKARCKTKMQMRSVDLQNDIQLLHSEIRGLESQSLCVWTVATKYCYLFRYGCGSLNTLTLAFLRSAMAPGVVLDGISCTPEGLLEHWRLFSKYFESIHFNFDRLEFGARSESVESVVAYTTTSLTISGRTLRYVFPQLNSDRHGGAQ